MRLNVGIFGSEKFFYTVAGKIFDDIDKFTSSVIPFTGIAFGVFIGKYASLCGKNLSGNKIFACDKLQPILLPLDFICYCLGNCFILNGEIHTMKLSICKDHYVAY